MIYFIYVRNSPLESNEFEESPDPKWADTNGHTLIHLRVTMKSSITVAYVLLLCLVIARCQQQQKTDRGVFDGQGRPDLGKSDFQRLNKLRQAQGEGGDDLEYKRYLQELMANNPG